MAKRWNALVWVATLSGLLGCGTELPGGTEQGGGGVGGGAPACSVGFPTACSCQPGSSVGQACDAQGLLTQCSCQAVFDPGPVAVTHPLPCEVSALLESSCLQCHGTTLQFTAPMSLVTYEDFQAPAPSDPTRKVYQLVAERIHHETAPMPPVPNPRLDTAALGVMDAWLAGGALAGTQASCNPTGPSAGEGGAGGAGGTGGTGYDPDQILPEDVECFEFRAHAEGNVGTGFPVTAGTKDKYYNFTFNAPWEPGAQAISFKAIVDNTQVIHHWLLYQNQGSVTEGGISSSSGTHGSDELVAGWAPGASDLILPADVGMPLATAFTLELHYNNAGASVQPDHSGVQVCVTHKPRTHEAGLHWLGTELIFLFGAGDAAGTCTPRTNMGPITILESWPHMHLKGTHMKTEIMRKGGGTEMLHDGPFDFNYQVAYDTPAVINPGDTLKTTCTFNSAATFGPGTDAEMCYNFVLAYPRGALSNPQGGGLTSSTNHCFQ